MRQVVIRVHIRRIRCHECGSFAQEPLSFCPNRYARHTKRLARYVIGLRSEMSISIDMSNAYGYRDKEYLHLKIYDLPNLSTVKRL